jgi:hypothetical protein
MIFGGASTVLLLAWQRIVIGSDGAFDISYSGTPAYAHITSVWYLVERASFMIGSRLDLVTGMIAFVLIGLIARRRELFAFPLACLPWMLLNVTSVDPNKHSLGIYGMFPMVIYLTAPLIASSVLAGNRVGSEQEDRSDVFNVLAYLVAFLSLFLGGIGGPPNGGGYVFHQLLRNRPVSPAIISATHDTIEAFASRERVAVDDAVMSLDPVLFENTPLISGVSDTATLDSALFFPAFVLGSASVRNLFEGWITANRKVVVTCLPGGLARADVADEPPSKPQTSLGQLQRAQRCHPSPSY